MGLRLQWDASPDNCVRDNRCGQPFLLLVACLLEYPAGVVVVCAWDRGALPVVLTGSCCDAIFAGHCCRYATGRAHTYTVVLDFYDTCVALCSRSTFFPLSS